MNRLTWYRYVRYADYADYFCAGWFPVADLGQTHGQWSVLMQWGGLEPPKDAYRYTTYSD